MSEPKGRPTPGACSALEIINNLRKSAPTDIVKIIQRCDTWGDVRLDAMGDLYVPVFFKTRADAQAFKVELMMVASGQRGYEKVE